MEVVGAGRVVEVRRRGGVEAAADQPALAGQEGKVQAHRLYGALFFGAVKLVEALEDQLPAEALIVDLKNVIYVDSSGADSLMSLHRACRKRGVRLIVCGLMHQPQDIAKRSGLLKQIDAASLMQDLPAGLAAAVAPLAIGSAPATGP